MEILKMFLAEPSIATMIVVFAVGLLLGEVNRAQRDRDRSSRLPSAGAKVPSCCTVQGPAPVLRSSHQPIPARSAPTSTLKLPTSVS